MSMVCVCNGSTEFVRVGISSELARVESTRLVDNVFVLNNNPNTELTDGQTN